MITPKKNIVTKVAGAAIKAVAKSGKPVKKVISNSRQAYDYPVSKVNAKNVVPKMGRRDAQISENVKIKNVQSPTGKSFIRGGAAQVMNQNVRAGIKANKVETKANARGLKAANSIKTPKLNKKDTKRFNTQIDKNAAQYKAAKNKSK